VRLIEIRVELSILECQIHNVMERFNQEQKRRTRTIRLFPNVESCERLVITIAMQIHEGGICQKKLRFFLIEKST